MTVHAIQRAKERYKLDLTFEDLAIILDLIANGDAKFSHKNRNATVYRLRYKHKLIVPVVSDDFNILTFNPIDGKPQRFVDKDGLFKKKRLKKAI